MYSELMPIFIRDILVFTKTTFPYIKICQNTIVAWAVPQTPLGKLTLPSDLLAGLGSHFLVER